MPTRFELASRQLPIVLVKAKVASKTAEREVLAIIDTGATGCVVAPKLAKELALKPVKAKRDEKIAQGIGGKVQIEIVEAERIECDGAIAKKMKIATMDLSIIERQLKRKRKKRIEMILGYSFFKGRTLAIDYKRKTLSIA